MDDKSSQLRIGQVGQNLHLMPKKTLSFFYLVLVRVLNLFLLASLILRKIVRRIASGNFPKSYSQLRSDIKKTHSILLVNKDSMAVKKINFPRFICVEYCKTICDVFFEVGVPVSPLSVKLFGHKLSEKFTALKKLEVFPQFLTYKEWVYKNSLNPKLIKRIKTLLAKGKVGSETLISIVVPVYNPPKKFLLECIKSVLDQIYQNWELVLVDDASTDPQIKKTLLNYIKLDNRIKVKFLERNQGISVATNEAINLARGDYVFFLDHDDVLSADALFHVAKAVGENPSLEWLYTDEDKVDENGRRYDPQFKGQWNHGMAQFHNYTHHATIVKRTVLAEIGGISSAYPGSQDFDLNLKLLACVFSQNIYHIPHVCYHWRSHLGSTASSGDQKPYILQSAKNAILNSLEDQNIKISEVVQPEIANQNRWTLFQPHAIDDHGVEEVTIVIPTKNRGDLVKNCLDSLSKTTNFSGLKIIIINDHSDDERSLRYFNEIGKLSNIVVMNSPYPPGEFNYARLINFASKHVTTKYFLQLNNDVEALAKNWLAEMLWWIKYPKVGIVGAKLIYPDQTIQHAGVFLGPHGGLADHQFHGLHLLEAGYCGLPHIAREVSAVTGACMLTRTDLFHELNGFDEVKFGIEYNDVDYCLRVIDRGEKIIFSPAAVLTHITSASRGSNFNPQEHINFIESYGKRDDKYIHPNFSRDNNSMELSGQYYPYIDIGGGFRVVVFTHALTLTGAPITAFEYALAFRERGYDVLVISFSDGPLKYRFLEFGISCEILFPDCDVYQISKSTLAGSIENIFEKFSISSDTDVVVGNTLLTFLPIEVAASRNIKTLWHIHESVDFKKFISLVGDLNLQADAWSALEHVDGVVFQAESTLELFRKYINGNKIIKISGGMPIERIKKYKGSNTKNQLREQYALPLDAHIVSIIGTTCDRKGQLEFLESMRMLVKRHGSNLPRNMIFMMVGAVDSEYTNLLRREISRAKELDVRLIAETENIYDYYLMTDTFVCNSKEESFPMVVLLAMAFMVPIVSTSVNGVVEMITSDVEGLLVPMGSNFDLSEAVFRSIINQENSKIMAKRSYAKLIRLYDKGRLMDLHENLINQIFYGN